MASEKTAVIKYLFDLYWDGTRLTRTLMTLDDVKMAIRECNLQDGKQRSDRNPANFLKDIVRSRGASQIWPAEVAALGYTGEQRTGRGDSFEFVPLKPGQLDPFPDLYRPTDSTPRIDLQSVSMSLASKHLGRRDEAWLVQTAVNLRVVEQHLATMSALHITQISHLQMTVKLRATEIDSLYLATLRDGTTAIVTCEAKQDSERILVGQIRSQVEAAFGTVDTSLVIPMAVRSVRGVGIHVLEFKAVHRASLATAVIPELASEAIYCLKPPVTGI